MPTLLERSSFHSVSLTDTKKEQTLYSKALHIHISAPNDTFIEYNIYPACHIVLRSFKVI